MTDEQLVLYYTIPTSEEEVPLEIPPPKPTVSITQPHIPQQMRQGTSVSIELDAQILKDSTPPYDYAWTNDLSLNPVPHFGSTFTITSIPVAAAPGGGPQTLTTAHLKVIDMFGQVAETQAKAQYLPARKQQQRQSEGSLAYSQGASASTRVIGSVPKWLLIALAGLVVLAASGIALALYNSGGQNASSCSSSSTGTGTDLKFTFPGTGPCYMSGDNIKGCGNQLSNGVVDFVVTGWVSGTKYTFEIRGGYTGPVTNMSIAVSPGSSINPNQLWDKLTGGKVIFNGNRGSVDDLMSHNINTSGTVQVSGTFACS